MEKKSYQYLQNIKATLEKLSDDIEKDYYKMHYECIKELEKDKKDKKIQNEEMLSLYKKLLNNDVMRLTWIKNKMPWYITKFFKISSNELMLIDNNVYIGVNFGKSQETNCFVQITPQDIGW